MARLLETKEDIIKIKEINIDNLDDFDKNADKTETEYKYKEELKVREEDTRLKSDGNINSRSGRYYRQLYYDTTTADAAWRLTKLMPLLQR